MAKFKGPFTGKLRVAHKGWVYHNAYERQKAGPRKLLWTAAGLLAAAAILGCVPWTS